MDIGNPALARTGSAEQSRQSGQVVWGRVSGHTGGDQTEDYIPDRFKNLVWKILVSDTGIYCLIRTFSQH